MLGRWNFVWSISQRVGNRRQVAGSHVDDIIPVWLGLATDCGNAGPLLSRVPLAKPGGSLMSTFLTNQPPAMPPPASRMVRIPSASGPESKSLSSAAVDSLAAAVKQSGGCLAYGTGRFPVAGKVVAGACMMAMPGSFSYAKTSPIRTQGRCQESPAGAIDTGMKTFHEWLAMREGLWLNDKHAVIGLSRLNPLPKSSAVNKSLAKGPAKASQVRNKASAKCSASGHSFR
jgi:hypothetical protein